MTVNYASLKNPPITGIVCRCEFRHPISSADASKIAERLNARWSILDQGEDPDKSIFLLLQNTEVIIKPNRLIVGYAGRSKDEWSIFRSRRLDPIFAALELNTSVSGTSLQFSNSIDTGAIGNHLRNSFTFIDGDVPKKPDLQNALPPHKQGLESEFPTLTCETRSDGLIKLEFYDMPRRCYYAAILSSKNPACLFDLIGLHSAQSLPMTITGALNKLTIIKQGLYMLFNTLTTTELKTFYNRTPKEKA